MDGIKKNYVFEVMAAQYCQFVLEEDIKNRLPTDVTA